MSNAPDFPRTVVKSALPRAQRLRILIMTPEAVPFAKTGGLADVAGALPKALAARGHDVRVVMPQYGVMRLEGQKLQTVLSEVLVHFPTNHLTATVRRGRLPGADVPVYFISNADMFDRSGYYGESGADYPDNPVRFAFFCMAALWTLKGIGWAPDVVQCNDWQSALAPVFLKESATLKHDPFFAKTKTLFTIHNLAYQGLCDPAALDAVGLPRRFFHAECMEFWGRLNILKGGIAFADWISTVSKRYAEEILTREHGCGLEGFLGTRRDRLTGILNGIDADAWNPAVDPNLAANYSADTIEGKAVCKAALEKTLGWEHEPDTPIFAMIGRLDPQKGVELAAAAIERLKDLPARWILLGAGKPEYAEALKGLSRRMGGRMHVRIELNRTLARQIEAGADAFLMPSRYEPCGLNQMYSLRYGAVPVVRATGGLADTVRQATPESIRAGRGNGFLFEEFEPEALCAAIREAFALYRDEPALWRRLQINGMREDHSWDRAAERYERLFQRILATRR